MITLQVVNDIADDEVFVQTVNQLITGAVASHQPSEVFVFKVDNWFDHKWLAFSGKFLGALGTWHKPITIPPFVANRIISGWHYVSDAIAGTYELQPDCRKIHHCGRAEENLHRSVRSIAPGAAIFWFSGNTRETGRGSLMGYIPVEGKIWPWFLAFVRKDGWQIARRKSIHEYEVRSFQSAGEEALTSPTANERACGE